jgi:hypothetical protein
MTNQTDKAELERRLEQARRLSSSVTDPLTKQRLEDLAHTIEDQLKKSE